MTNEVILSVEGVSKSFLGTKALDKVSLEVCKGEVHGVIGENGAGKSTLMNTIFGSLQRDEGTIRFMGEEVHFKCPEKRNFYDPSGDQPCAAVYGIREYLAGDGKTFYEGRPS